VTSSSGIPIEIVLGQFSLVADPLGTFRFVAVPRVGELIAVDTNGERTVLSVENVTHYPISESGDFGSIPIRVRCIKVLG
jgi:hypothetical protein